MDACQTHVLETQLRHSMYVLSFPASLPYVLHPLPVRVRHASQFPHRIRPPSGVLRAVRQACGCIHTRRQNTPMLAYAATGPVRPLPLVGPRLLLRVAAGRGPGGGLRVGE